MNHSHTMSGDGSGLRGAAAVLQTHPRAAGGASSMLTNCIESCFDCASACSACADACLAEDSVAELRRCIRMNLDCADLCIATGQVLSRLLEPSARLRETLLQACMAACIACAEECEIHGQHHPHCAACAEECRQCADACRAALDGYVVGG